MKTLLRLLRMTIFVVIAPLLAIAMAFIFLVPPNLDMWFSNKRRDEAVDVWRKLWNWAEGQPDGAYRSISDMAIYHQL